MTNSLSLRPVDKKVSPAVALLKYRNSKAPVTILLTTRCDLACEHCYVPKPATPLDLDPDIARAAIAELRGLERLYFSGGEPFRYLAGREGHEQIFMELVRQAAENVGRLYIDTNGMFLPLDQQEAIEALARFPKNTSFMLSADGYHAAAAAKRGRSLQQMIATMEAACAANGLELEYNARQINRGYSKAEVVQGLRREFGIDPARKIHLNSVLAQGEAAKLAGAKPLSHEDFIDHAAKKILSIGLFVTFKGLVISGEHAACLENPPAYAVAGDLNRATLTRVLWDSLKGQARYLTHGPHYYRLDLEKLETIFKPEDAKKIMKQILTESDGPGADELELSSPPPDQPVIWESRPQTKDKGPILNNLLRKGGKLLRKFLK
jgi:pyruvate-formate lyase-activating enzyme